MTPLPLRLIDSQRAGVDVFGSRLILHAYLFEQLSLYQFVIKPPLHALHVIVFDGSEKAYWYLESARAAPPAPIVASRLSGSQSLFQELVGV
jgi:hypothetical protein